MVQWTELILILASILLHTMFQISIWFAINNISQNSISDPQMFFWIWYLKIIVKFKQPT